MQWSQEQIDVVKAGWAAGLRAVEIGRRVGVSGHAVIGKAHRLGLPRHPSLPPLKEGAAPVVRRYGRGRSLPALASIAAPFPRIVAKAAARIVPIKPADVVVLIKPGGRVMPCCWPIGEPRDRKSFRFCEATSEPGKVYCTDHAKIAYARVRDRRDDAA